MVLAECRGLPVLALEHRENVSLAACDEVRDRLETVAMGADAVMRAEVAKELSSSSALQQHHKATHDEVRHNLKTLAQ
jgi:hypothetical protein